MQSAWRPWSCCSRSGGAYLTVTVHEDTACLLPSFGPWLQSKLEARVPSSKEYSYERTAEELRGLGLKMRGSGSAWVCRNRLESAGNKGGAR